MKFEEASLTEYLVKNLDSLTEADPAILAKYVVALLKKDKPTEELRRLCTDNLVEFLGNGADSFTAKLFEALEDDAIAKVDRISDLMQKPKPSQAPISEGIRPLKNLLPEEEILSSSSEPSSDPEDKEISDDDDDRNHKHRRREARRNSFETDAQEPCVRKMSRKRNKPYDNGQVFLDTHLQASEIQKEYNPISERNIPSKLDNHHSDLTPLLRAPLDLGTRTRFSLPLRNDPGPRFEFSSSIGHPIGRGRGRSSVLWNQLDSRFNAYDTLDFTSQMASQGPAHPGLFVGAGLPSAASTQNSSWGGFGFITSMSNGIMDPLNPLGLHGSLRPAINPPLNIGMPRQHCRDFEERGFCLRGDMCPMEHGLNRIVVEDVQSLSQFNLPVSIPSSHPLGIHAGARPLPSVPTPSGQLANTKPTSSKGTKSEAVDDTVMLDDMPSTSGGANADVYDPDQPLWSNSCPDASATLLRIPSPNIDDVPSWNGDSLAQRGTRSDGIENEVPSRIIVGSSGSQNANSSVWGRIGSGNKSDTGSRIDNTIATGRHGDETNKDHVEVMHNNHASNQRKIVGNTENVSNTIIGQPFARSHTDPVHKSGRAFHKALRTLYVYGIPQKNNRRDTLFSHFQKYGEVIDIYIPLNTEKAFVQFSKREEAEAALKSPDAVMGNRFIKLSWANRDRIPDTCHNMSVQPPTVVATSVPSKQPIANGGNGTLPAQRRTSIPAVDAPLPTDMPVKVPLSSAMKTAPPTQKKMENLELLEELRRKQESLDKKRDEFRRQLDKFEKQAVSNKKVDVVSEQAAKRRKVDASAEAEKAAVPKNFRKVAEKSLETGNSEGILISNGSKVNSTILQQASGSTAQTSSLPVFLPNRFKLDNRSTSFRILPPLPAGFASVDFLKDYFSRYGVVTSIVLEDPDLTEEEGQTLSENCSACITFTTRQVAERAYQSGRFWEGHTLQFKWLTVSPNSYCDSSFREATSSSSPTIASGPVSQPNPEMFEPSSPGAEKSTCSSISDVALVGPTGHVEGTNSPPLSLLKTPGESSI